MRSFSPDLVLGRRFARIATLRGDAPALIYDDARISFAELDHMRRGLASAFLANGLGPRRPVVIDHDKSPAGYAAMLAALTIGAPYLNIDPGNPPPRLAAIFDYAQPKLAVTAGTPSPNFEAAAAAHGLSVLDLEKIRMRDVRREDGPVVTGSAAAYFMFTSGSTGVPKGAALSHTGIDSFIDWVSTYFDIQDGDVFTGINPIYFDNSVFDFYGALFNGAALAPMPDALLRQPDALAAAVARRRCTIWFSVPSMLVYLSAMKMLGAAALDGVRAFVFGGEGYPKAELKKLYDRRSAQARIVNVYGPTEASCICSAHDVGPADFEDMTTLAPLGRLNPNFEGLVLDGDSPVADGAVGELCLLGPHVALGYVNDPARTTAAFTDNPLNRAWSERMYRTGDLVTRDPDGILRFRGRADNQIKHMGYRIELEEIEAAINADPRIAEAVAIYRRPNPARPGRIVAFAATAAGAVAPEPQDFLEALRARLPSYMSPDRILFRSALPKNANGKTDRRALQDVSMEDS